MGVMFASFQASGTNELVNELVYIEDRIEAKLIAHLFSTFGCKPSVPADLLMFKLIRIFRILSGENILRSISQIDAV